jgi:hypothetical protein
MHGKFSSVVVIDVTSAQEERSVLESVLLPSVVEESITDTYRTIVVLPIVEFTGKITRPITYREKNQRKSRDASSTGCLFTNCAG